MNQWQSTQDVLKWFRNIENPSSYAFLKFDMVAFYPSIRAHLVKKALAYARTIDGIVIPKIDEDMIFQCRKTFLYNEGQPWKKRGQENFDVPMGSHDGAEISELVGLYLLHKLTHGKGALFERKNVGLYRDDGLAIIKIKQSGRTAERSIKPKLNNLFNIEDLKITVDPVSQVTEYLDVKLNLVNHTHEPYRKPNNPISYINVKSNHPKHIFEHLPKMIQQRLSILSSNEEIFERCKGPYEKALNEAGYNCKLTYQTPATSNKRKRYRKAIYFKPPYSISVETNVIKLFLNLKSKHFPKGHKLNKCFNRNTVKATYCTLTNMKEKIGIHNAKILSEKDPVSRNVRCNCRDKSTCPIPSECNQYNVVYQAEVHTNNKTMKYFGSTENFKSRYSAHKSSFNKRPANHTTLSSYIWKLKDENTPFEISWSIKTRGHAFSSGGRSCDLCLSEKLVILTEDKQNMLNKRDELLETCRHRRKHLLVALDSG